MIPSYLIMWLFSSDLFLYWSVCSFAPCSLSRVFATHRGVVVSTLMIPKQNNHFIGKNIVVTVIKYNKFTTNNMIKTLDQRMLGLYDSNYVLELSK